LRAAAAPADAWRGQFRFDHVKVLIVCRGPIRLEAIAVCERMGTQPCGILLSEKDSVVHARALSPELRHVGRNERVHRIPDYAGADAAQKARRIAQILDIARAGGYTHVFAGYGFMAEDHEFIAAVEAAGLGFVGPSAAVARGAGAKDAAKALARKIGVSVTPGLDNIVALALLSQAPQGQARDFLLGLAKRHALALSAESQAAAPEALAEAVLGAATARKIELVTLPQLQREAERQVARLLREHPGRRFRLKHVAGGGGKGQRIVSRPDEAAAAVFEVLTESKAAGPGDNRNFLIELNIESTRHNEIQLLGNGQWCIALGGRDCSLQMHEQKLLEVSITEELLTAAALAYRAQGRAAAAAVLTRDLAVLREMERQAEAFGQAVGLDSASTFESIVEGDHHYFMEVNTRIQVEHRVTEMVYSLRFRNPDEPAQALAVESLVEAMLWVAVHGPALPRPERVPRHGSGVEARINATNDALRPHAGGVVLDWTPPGEDELRDDQGIGIRNPDTGTFMSYHLAGAYDSNAALIVTHGATREDNFRRLGEILRRMEVRGDDVMTNQRFHYGLVHWMLGADPMVKPTTRFVQGYLGAVGALKLLAQDVDVDLAWRALTERMAARGPDAQRALAAKETLLPRPLALLLAQPHLLAGWLAPRPVRRWELKDGRALWRQNPLAVLDQLYRFLRLEEHPGVSPEEQIWTHDRQLLDDGLAFYRDLLARLGREEMPWKDLAALLEDDRPPRGVPAALWPAAQAAHRGHQAGMDLLRLPALLGEEAGFFGLQANARLEPVVPERFLDERHLAAALAALAPPPPARSNQIVAWTGGTFYTRPSPADPPYAAEGRHLEPGDVAGLLEVMKMFNPLRVEFGCTVTRVLVPGEGGVVVAKGQVLFEVQPDVPPQETSEAERQAARAARTRALVEKAAR
jgi:acetyl/propionyl-CoA carboxylase alpha subunit